MDETEAAKSKGRFAFVDALRGFAALAVVLFHAIEGDHVRSLPEWLRIIIGHGHLGVAIFFVLSGFVIAHSLRDQRMTLGEAARFMMRRSIRLDPPYWVAIAIAVGFSLLATALIKGRPAEEYTAGQLLAHPLYLQGILGYRNINPVFWTLCYEVQFYLVFAVLLVTRSWALIFAAFAISLAWPLGLIPIIRGLFVNLWFGFLLGVGAYYAWTSRKALPWFAVYAGILLFAALFRHDEFALTCAGTAVLIVAVAKLGYIGSLDWRWLQYLGTISYSLYLLHNPITGATFRVGYLLTGRTAPTEWVWWITSIAASVLAAMALYYFVERPCIRLSRIAIQFRSARLTSYSEKI